MLKYDLSDVPNLTFLRSLDTVVSDALLEYGEAALRVTELKRELAAAVEHLRELDGTLAELLEDDDDYDYGSNKLPSYSPGHGSKGGAKRGQA